MLPHAQSQVKSVPPIGVPFAAIPLDVMRRSDLTPAAKLVFAALANNARMRRGDASTWTNAQVAAAVGMTASGVRRPLDELEAAGLVSRSYGASERTRTAVAITYGPAEVGAGAATPARPPAPQHQPGCRPGAPGVGAPTATPLSTKNEEPERTGSSPLDSGEKKPSPAQVAAAMRAMVAGKFAPLMFDAEAKDTHAHSVSPSPAKGVANPDPLPAKGIHETSTLPDVRTMFGRVGYSARAAAYRRETPKRSAAEQIAELRRRSAAREREGYQQC